MAGVLIYTTDWAWYHDLGSKLLFLFAYLMSDDNATRLPAFNWFKRLIIVAFVLLSIGLFMTFGYFWG
ncbi:hypothetical protein [Psychrobacter sp. JCM 18900]|uniref:hypothetical protein n=1 Tax=Psychrobacter sp. JCM 18900 TaxID=1298608 RepID=UPI0004B9C304|nr:hypothetical protein [Psychrobacter sp. JCM 18900]